MFAASDRSMPPVTTFDPPAMITAVRPIASTPEIAAWPRMLPTLKTVRK
jgi:hypothetical protein